MFIYFIQAVLNKLFYLFKSICALQEAFWKHVRANLHAERDPRAVMHQPPN